MALPTDPTPTTLCRAALRRSGQPAPSQGMVEDAVANQFQEVKNDIKLFAPTHPLLKTSEVLVTTKGIRNYAQPTNAHSVKSILFYDGPDAWRFSSQGATTSTISTTVAFGSSLGSANDAIGKKAFVLAGTGALQWSNITNYAINTLTVSPVFSTAPTAGASILVATQQVDIWNESRHSQNYSSYEHAVLARPTTGSLEDETLWLNSIPDKVYPMIWEYYQDLDQVNEYGSLFTKIMREWRTLFVMGVAAKSADLYDDTRAGEFKSKYDQLMLQLQHECLQIGQMEMTDAIIV